jgi:uncharacterized protein (TIGR02147 family)
MKTAFEFKDYKAFVNYALESGSQPSRGIRTRMAEAIQCHSAYVSQVLNGDSHFSPEQGESLAKFLGLSKGESQYFLNSLFYARAGTQSLREYFSEQMSSLKEEHFVLKNRLQYTKSLSKEDHATFYSSWHYGAVHVAVTIPSCQTQSGLCEYIGLSLQRVNEILSFLKSVGLVTEKSGRFQIGATHINLGSDSPLISKHHTNWRMKAVQSMDAPRKSDLHYSSVITASKEDLDKIRSVLVKAIEDVRSIVKPSKEEACFSYNIDFFDLKNKF